MEKTDTCHTTNYSDFYERQLESFSDLSSGEASALCPFHDDEHPSFSVNLDTGLWHCHAGCGGGDVYSFVMKRYGVRFSEAVKRYAKEDSVYQTASRHITRAHRWEDVDGHVAYHLRWSTGPKFTWAQDQDGHTAGRGSCQPTVYGLQAVQASDEVIVVEGERDAEALNGLLTKLGRFPRTVATCTPNGAGDVKDAYFNALTDKTTVWISGDNDSSGQQYIERCIRVLIGRPSSIRKLLVPVDCKDWAEWVARPEAKPEVFGQLLEQASTISVTAHVPEPSRSIVVLSVNPSAADVADAFLEAHGYRDHEGLRLRWYRGEWYCYEGKVFASVSTDDLKAEIMAFLQKTVSRGKAKRSFVGDVLSNLEGLCRMVPSAVTLPARWMGETCIPQPDTVVMQNGVVDLGRIIAGDTEAVLSTHTPALISTVCLSFAYDPAAECPRWRMFLQHVLPDSESQQCLQEVFGYCLTYDTTQQKFFLFEGDGANGKGVVLQILTRLLGEANVSGLPLESFSETHGLESTLGKLVNVTSEVGDLDRVSEGKLKQFTGEDWMSFNPKYRPAFTAKATARLVIATNVRPPFRDRSNGLWRRLLIIPFPVSIPEHQRNRQLADELATELAGIFNWAVAGAQALRVRGHFSEPAVSRVAREEFQRDANPARVFLEERYGIDPDGDGVGKQVLYQEYHEFCVAGGYRPLNLAKFSQEVQRVYPAVKQGRPRGLEEARYRTWIGLSPKRDLEEVSHDGIDEAL